MVKSIVKWTDGDSGEMVDSNGSVKRFRLSNVSAPEKHAPGYNLATDRSEKMVSVSEVVDVKTVGRDSYGRDLVEIYKGGRNINHVLEMKNKLFGIEPPKQKKPAKKNRRPSRSKRT